MGDCDTSSGWIFEYTVDRRAPRHLDRHANALRYQALRSVQELFKFAAGCDRIADRGGSGCCRRELGVERGLQGAERAALVPWEGPLTTGPLSRRPLSLCKHC
ncbi:unnamed protein product [Arctia plantaginis]|uniref:Uncharacterized protein n=1 Tax=Arctia plantaginis TaxID=874455 RepID=A0A8S0ZN89_ARCPL|nr:unnamed protein product [Arctia plantaginis]